MAGMIGATLYGDVALAVMPASLTYSTVHSAIQLAAGKVSMAEKLSASVCELTNRGLKMMRFANLKTATSLVGALSLVFAVSVLAQYQPANPPGGVVTPHRPFLRSEPSSAVPEPRGNVEKGLLRLERAWANGIANRDRGAVDSILAEDIIVTDPVGRTWDKAKYLTELGINAWGIDSYELRDISIRVYARAAVVTGRAMVKTNASNPSGTGPYRVTNTYILYDGRWRCVASHNSSLFDQPASHPVFQDIPMIPLLPHPQSVPITSPR
jgi:ketosteroid isomerase-like protein